MIAHVAGRVAEKTETAVIIDVGGIGYEVQVPGYERDAARAGETIKLYTHYHIRETAHELFGFSTLTAKRLFEMLITVSGVGPKMALAILNLGEVESIRSAIALGDGVFIEKASGVGKRIAGRIAVDLKDKVGLPGTRPVIGATMAEQVTGRDDALDALLALGYNLQQANEALGKVDANLDAQTRIKQALKLL
jgi:holliday junction DNA helicase RuvA